MSIYTGVGDIAKRVTAIYAGVNGTARKIVRAYAGDENGVAQLVYSSGNLPSGYQQVEYIESTGTQYIDTGLKANQNTGFSITVLTKNNLSSSDYGCLFGARSSTNKNEYQLTTYVGSSGGTFRKYTTSYSASMAKNVKLTCSATRNKYTNRNGEAVSINTTTYSTPVSVTVFALNNNGSIIQYGKHQLFSLKFTDNGTIIRDYYPCYRKSDNEPGLYDIITDTFLTNTGTGTFGVGGKYEQIL